jgi:hypothetical protein
MLAEFETSYICTYSDMQQHAKSKASKPASEFQYTDTTGELKI